LTVIGEETSNGKPVVVWRCGAVAGGLMCGAPNQLGRDDVPPPRYP